MNTLPIVSVGIPVQNGDNYISKAIESILDQTFKDLEIIICDNASTDNTEKICQYYKHLEKRIKYIRNERNIGAGPNFNLAFKMSRGKYFKWLAHDDICSKDYIEKCYKILNKNSKIVLCHSLIDFIDAYGNRIIRDYRLPKSQNINSSNVNKRFKSLISLEHFCNDIFGLIKRSELEKTKLFKSFIGSDRLLLAELSLKGKFFRIPEVLFFSRDHSKRSIKFLPLHKRNQWWDTRLNSKIQLPHIRILLEYLLLLKNKGLNISDRLKCLNEIIFWIRDYWHPLAKDIEHTYIAMLDKRGP